jgi:hypothetical protein
VAVVGTAFLCPCTGLSLESMSSTLGYSADRWEELAAALRAQHLTQDARPSGRQEAGQVYTIRAMLAGRNEQSALIVSVWFIPKGEQVPRFVTAYPGGAP